MIQLRPNQTAAADAVEDAYRTGCTRPLVDSCVGSGKSLTIGELARRAWARGERSLILAHTRELVEQNAAACRALGLHVGINAAALGERTWRAPVISAAIQSVYKSAHNFGPVANIMTDECFPAGTMVSTPNGDVPIEDIFAGDTVNHALGAGKVEAKSWRIVSELVKVKFDDGSSIRCTETHPLFTLQGWQFAGRLEAGARVVRDQGVRELRDGVYSDPTEWTGGERAPLEQNAFLLDILFQESRELYERPGGSGTDDSNDSCDRTQAADSGRQRSRDDDGTGGVDWRARSGMGSGITRADRQAAGQRLSATLQNRHSESEIADCNRSGRSIAPREAPASRRKKGRSLALARVVSVSRVKLARHCAVYNLQVAGHPSYFANGLLAHNCHLIPHSESGMYREFARGFPGARMPGFSGTVFRLQGGSLVEGEGAPFDRVVYRYSILDGIRDGYLVPAFSVAADDKVDVSKLRKRQGEYDTASQDAQMLALMDNHIAQMVHHGASRRAWLVFEASTKSAHAMAERLRQWGVAAGLVLGETPAAERAATIEAFRRGRLRCLVNVAALTTGFDVQEVDMLVMRRRTMSLGLYIQMTGRLLRTIGGHIERSIAAGKADGIVLDFAGNIDQHGPLDFIRPKDTTSKLVSCESCGKRNGAAAMRCWSCDEPMTKLCPACLVSIRKGLLDCPECGHDMRTGSADGTPRAPKLLETPSGAALIAAFRPATAREGGWVPVRKAWERDGAAIVDDADGTRWELPAPMARRAAEARWVRPGPALLVPNGASRTTVVQIMADGAELIVPMPPAAGQVAA